MVNNFGGVNFNEEDLDNSIAELGIVSDLPIENQRAMAAYAMLILSMAMAIKDEDQYQVAISEIEGGPTAEEDLEFLVEYSGELTTDLVGQFDASAKAVDVFIQRASEFIEAAALC